MRVAQINFVIVSFLLLILTSCCGFQVKDISGIQACLEKANLSEQEAFDLKGFYSAESPEYEKASELYNVAVSKVKTFFQTIDLEVAGTFKADVGEEEFTGTEIEKSLDAFLTQAAELKKQRSGEPDSRAKIKSIAGVTLAITVANFVIDKIVELDNEKKAAGYKRFREVLFNGVPQQFSLLTEKYMLEKYSVNVKKSPKFKSMRWID